MFRMENWMKVSLLLCVFGFLREMRPSEPFAVEFFIQHRNFTNDELTNYYYPMGTYSYMAQLVIIFLITDILRYKPIIVLASVMGMLLFGLLAWAKSRLGIQMAQIAFGTFMACEVAYYTYIYAKVERSKYQMVTGHTRSAILAGRFLGAVLAQLLVSLNFMNYEQLLYISFGSQCVSMICSICLPSVGVSLYFYSNNSENDLNKLNTSSIDSTIKTIPSIEKDVASIEERSIHLEKNQKNKARFSFSMAIARLAIHFKTSYSNLSVVQWSIWWAIAMCGFLQVQSYIQTLWKEIDATETNLYNGAVEALITLLGSICAFAAGFLESKQFNRYEIWILTMLTLVEGLLLMWAAVTTQLWHCYCAYVLFGTIYHFMITVASATVAKKLHEDCFALIFGINTLIALILQSLLTFVAITKLDLNLRIQYQLYAYCFFTLAIIYAIVGAVKVVIVPSKKKIYATK